MDRQDARHLAALWLETYRNQEKVERTKIDAAWQAIYDALLWLVPDDVTVSTVNRQARPAVIYLLGEQELFTVGLASYEIDHRTSAKAQVYRVPVDPQRATVEAVTHNVASAGDLRMSIDWTFRLTPNDQIPLSSFVSNDERDGEHEFATALAAALGFIIPGTA